LDGIFVSRSSLSIEGLGWSRGGDFEGTEYRLNGGEWKPVTHQNDTGFHPFVIDLKLDEGENVLEVRSLGGGSYSLVDSLTIQAHIHPVLGQGGSPLIFGVLGALALIGVCAFIAYRYLISRRRSG
jgi:hypothetical protein